MDKDTLIAKQALEIANMQERIDLYQKCAARISTICVGIGGPLNDNILGYSNKQIVPFFEINDLATRQGFPE